MGVLASPLAWRLTMARILREFAFSVILKAQIRQETATIETAWVEF
ncbi:hypothetical protein SX4_2198 [Vibrio mimicus SX-4]|nr:hypothetical protein SX4_2198 [Vibrio mimicus SX-4]